MRDHNRFTPTVLQAQVLHGLPAGITLYGGVQLADDYRAAALGVGKDLGSLGAFLDVTHAQARFDDDDEQGNPTVFSIPNVLMKLTQRFGWWATAIPQRVLHPERMGIAAE
jgi:outer membrane usher protein FimD/PapC